MLNTLVQLDPIYVTFNPERDRSRRHCSRRGAAGKVEADVLLPGETQPSPQGRTDLHRQHGRPRDRHGHGARHDRQRRLHAAARPVCARPAARAANSPTRCWCRRSRSARASSANIVYVVGEGNKVEQAPRVARPDRRRSRGVVTGASPRATRSSSAICRRSARACRSSRCRAIKRPQILTREGAVYQPRSA